MIGKIIKKIRTGFYTNLCKKQPSNMERDYI